MYNNLLFLFMLSPIWAFTQPDKVYVLEYVSFDQAQTEIQEVYETGSLAVVLDPEKTKEDIVNEIRQMTPEPNMHVRKTVSIPLESNGMGYNMAYHKFFSKSEMRRRYIVPGSYMERPVRLTVIQDAFDPSSWHIDGTTKMIDSVLCYRATTSFRCRTYEAWFNPEIPLPAGPFVFHGLPGVIVEVQDDEGKFGFSLQRVLRQAPSLKVVEFDDTPLHELPDFCSLQAGWDKALRLLRAKLGPEDCKTCDSRISAIRIQECFEGCE